MNAGVERVRDACGFAWSLAVLTGYFVVYVVALSTIGIGRAIGRPVHRLVRVQGTER